MESVWLFVLFSLSTLFLSNRIVTINSEKTDKLPIVYVYTVVPAVCQYGLPEYIKHTLEQASFTQPDCDIIMASNYIECEKVQESIINMSHIHRIDTALIQSNRTKTFLNTSKNILQEDYSNELWLTSALRFFNMEDIMIRNNYTELLHVEADNLLYGRLTDIALILRNGYKSLAATPLNASKTFITASVFWIANLAALLEFNDFLLELGSNINNQWTNYLKWLRPHACCKKGGVDQDSEGNGIKPFAINEMSMLAFYHHISPEKFKLFPVVPSHNYVLNRHICNVSEFGPGGRDVGPSTGNGIWDPNSWGQLIGGTSNKRGRDKGFTDASHLAGQAIRTNQCTVKLLCRNLDKSTDSCYTAPHIRCGGHEELTLHSEHTVWTPLWNLHVHSKNTKEFLSQSCICPSKYSNSTSSLSS